MKNIGPSMAVPTVLEAWLASRAASATPGTLRGVARRFLSYLLRIWSVAED